MKARVISKNEARKTAQIVVKYTNNDDRKRSETRHCQQAGDKWRGYVLDADKARMSSLQTSIAALASELDALRRNLDIKAQPTPVKSLNLLFSYDLDGDNGPAYRDHVNSETSKARAYIRDLDTQAELLRARWEVMQVERSKQRKQAA